MAKPKRDFDSKITDQGLLDAFREGFEEGAGPVQNPVTWVLEVRYEGTMLYQASFTVGVDALQKAAKYMDTPGTEITITVTQETPNADSQQEELEEGVVEGEILEDVEIEPRD